MNAVVVFLTNETCDNFNVPTPHILWFERLMKAQIQDINISSAMHETRSPAEEPKNMCYEL